MTGAVDYVLIGHIAADLANGERFLGGTVSYASPVIGAFGLRVGVLTRAATDEPLLAQLAPFAQIRALSSPVTTTFENIYEPEGRRQYVRAVADPLGVEDVPPEWLSASLVQLGPIAGEVDPQLVFAFPQAIKLLTLQGWLRRRDEEGRVHFKRWFDPAVLKAVDIVVFSEEDIREAPDLETEFARSVRHLIVTRGENGGTYYRDGEAIPYAAVPVAAHHLTGAGDVFAASLLSCLHILNQQNAVPGDKFAHMQTAISVSAALAAISVTRAGLDSAPTPQEVQQTLSTIARSGEKND